MGDQSRADERGASGGSPTGARPLQLSIIDGNEKPVGPLLSSVFVGSNSDLMSAVAPLYLTGPVLDVTYGRGMWWRYFRPEPFGFHDLELDGVDFRALPYADRSWRTVCFDPPYVPRHGDDHVVCQRDLDFRDRYGLSESRSQSSLDELLAAGLAECARVMDRWLLVKCNDYCNGRRFVMGHYRMLQRAEELGLRVHDLIVHHTGPGPGGSQIKIALRARRAHSYLLVLERPGRRTKEATDA